MVKRRYQYTLKLLKELSPVSNPNNSSYNIKKGKKKMLSWCSNDKWDSAKKDNSCRENTCMLHEHYFFIIYSLCNDNTLFK